MDCCPKPLYAADSIAALAQKHGFHFGTAVSATQLMNDPEVARTVIRECDTIVAENAFKWKQMEPKKGQYDAKNARFIQQFAKTNNLRLRGHTMVWNQDNRIQDFFLEEEKKNGKLNRDKLKDHMQRHIIRMLAMFPDAVSWDIVNEIITPWEGAIRDTAFTRSMNIDFLDFSFALVKELAPDKQRVYNDYPDWMERPNHRIGVLKLLEEALGRGVPIQALGVQSHLGKTIYADLDEKGWREFLTEVQGMGMDVLITELDCFDGMAKGNAEQRDQVTADHIKHFLDITLDFTNVREIMVWGITDRGSYSRAPNYTHVDKNFHGELMRCHLYDDQIKIKQPYEHAIREAIIHAPARAVKS